MRRPGFATVKFVRSDYLGRIEMKIKNIFYIFFALAAVSVFEVLSWLVGNVWLSDKMMDKFDNADIVAGVGLSFFTLCLGLYAWLRKSDIRRWFRGRNFESVGEPFDIPREDFVAAVIPVSKATVQQPIWILNWLQPSFASLVYTRESKQNALALINEFEGRGVTFYPNAHETKEEKFMLADPDRPNESLKIVKKFLQYYLRRGISVGNIFVDTTAGKVPTSIGAFQAAEEFEASTFYVVGTKNGLIKNGRRMSDGHPVFISRHE